MMVKLITVPVFNVFQLGDPLLEGVLNWCITAGITFTAIMLPIALVVHVIRRS